MAEETKEKKNKKISKMSAGEVDQAIKKAHENKNNDVTKYVQHLNERKAELAGK
jgi:hypothetical protein